MKEEKKTKKLASLKKKKSTTILFLSLILSQVQGHVTAEFSPEGSCFFQKGVLGGLL